MNKNNKKKDIWWQCYFCPKLNKQCPKPLPKLKNINNPHICLWRK